MSFFIYGFYLRPLFKKATRAWNKGWV